MNLISFCEPNLPDFHELDFCTMLGSLYKFEVFWLSGSSDFSNSSPSWFFVQYDMSGYQVRY
jgi:hypothetical protein